MLDAHGRVVTLGRRIGGGGEAEVFEVVGDDSVLAKVYTDGRDRTEKLKTLAAVSGLPNVVAWPKSLLFDAKARRAVGFTMSKVANGRILQCLFNPAQRLQWFPKAGWRFQVRAAYNCAAAFEEIHKAGCLVADVNQSNILVLDDATIRVIDADSFQVTTRNGVTHLCEVGTDHYTPPELMGAALDRTARTLNHDAYGLAVLIFQLLFLGRHPYMGVYHGTGEPLFGQLIREFRFAYGPNAAAVHMSPPPYSLTLEELPPPLALLFRQAFERGAERDGRPGSNVWLGELRSLEYSLAACGRDDGHHYWRGLSECPWCRIAAGGGPDYYIGAGTQVQDFVCNQQAIDEVMARLRDLEFQEPRYQRHKLMPAHPPGPSTGLLRFEGPAFDEKVVEIALKVSAGLAVGGLFLHPLLYVALPCLLIFGFWLTHIRDTSPQRQAQRRQRERLDAAQGEVQRLERQWREICDRHLRRQDEHGRAIKLAMSNARELGKLYAQEKTSICSHAEEAARTQFLQLHTIAEAEIPQIGNARKAALEAAGILTAADVTERAVYAVRGFGPTYTRNVMQWKRAVYARFRFDSSSAISRTQLRDLSRKFSDAEAIYVEESRRRLRDLEVQRKLLVTELTTLKASLRASLKTLAQAEVDLAFVS